MVALVGDDRVRVALFKPLRLHWLTVSGMALLVTPGAKVRVPDPVPDRA